MVDFEISERLSKKQETVMTGYCENKHFDYRTEEVMREVDVIDGGIYTNSWLVYGRYQQTKKNKARFGMA